MPVSLLYEPKALQRQRGIIVGLNEQHAKCEAEQLFANTLLNEAVIGIPVHSDSLVSNRNSWLSKKTHNFIQQFSDIFQSLKLETGHATVKIDENEHTKYPKGLARRKKDFGHVNLEQITLTRPESCLGGMESVVLLKSVSGWTGPSSFPWDTGCNVFASIGELTDLSILAFGFAHVENRTGMDVTPLDQDSRNFAGQAVFSAGDILDQALAHGPKRNILHPINEMVNTLRLPWPKHLQKAIDDIYQTQTLDNKVECSISFSCWTEKEFSMINKGNHYCYLIGQEGIRDIHVHNSTAATADSGYTLQLIEDCSFNLTTIDTLELAEKHLFFSTSDIRMELDSHLNQSFYKKKHIDVFSLSEGLRNLLGKNEKVNILFSIFSLDSKGMFQC